jgi:NAD(P)-dependent dehydrogenase (short-subunit alcohol dehydrogenase family)
MDLGLRGKTALITGAASGIGKATALRLAEEGAGLQLLDIQEEALREVAESAAALGVDVATASGDLSMAAGVESCLAGVDATGEHVPDVVVNCAGNTAVNGFDDLTDEDWQRSFDLNLMSTVRVLRALLPGMRVRGGSIVNVSSDFGRQPESISLDYAVAKAGILSITKGLAMAEAPAIRVNAVAPGPVATPLWYRPGGFGDTLGEFHSLPRDEAIEHELKLRRLPMARLGQPEEVAAVIVFLASEAASFVTNSVYGVDGGSVRSLLT